MIEPEAIEAIQGGRFKEPVLLGAGGMGLVWSVFDSTKGRRVALKTLKNASADALFRLKNEFRALADVRHPNLVQLYELLLADGFACITMELVEGEVLPSFLTTTLGPKARTLSPAESTFADLGFEELPSPEELGSSEMDAIEDAPCRPDDLRAILPQLMAGVEALHAAGKLHRDIKPSNVMVTPEGRVVLLDFGLVTGTEQRDRQRVGTPSFMAPEQLMGNATEASDWYGVGALLYRGLTGRPPHVLREGDLSDLAARKLTQMPPHPSLLVEDVDEELADLVMDLLALDPHRRPDATDIAERLGIEWSSPRRMQGIGFFGRAAELGVLVHALQSTRRGRPNIVRVCGPSGIGKSALIEHFLSAQSAAEPTLRALQGRCYEREQVPFKGIDAMMDALAEQLGEVPREVLDDLVRADIGALAFLFPVLERVPGIEAPRRGSDVNDQRLRALTALRRVLQELAGLGPLVAYIDDVQWIDADGVAVLEELLRPPAAPVLWLFGFRTDVTATAELGALLEAGPGREAWNVVLDPLGQAEARELAMAVLGERDPARIEGVLSSAEGSPFYIRELSRHAPDALSGASSLDAVLAERITRLEPEARRVLEVVAVAGYPIAQAIALEAAGMADELLVVKLASEHFIRIRGTSAKPIVEPLHDRVREVAAAACGEPVAVHRSLAQVLDANGADPEIVAEHWLGAGEDALAAAHALTAARNSRTNLAFARAIALYELVDRILPPDHPERARLPAEMAGAWAEYGRPLQAAPLYLQCAENERGQSRLELMRQAADQYFAAGRFELGIDVLRAVLESVGRRIRGGRIITLLRVVWTRIVLEVRGLGFDAVDPADVPRETLLEADAYWAVSRGLAFVDVIRAQEYQQYALLAALRIGDPYRVACNLSMEVGFLGAQGGPAAEKTRVTAARCAEIARQSGSEHAVGLAAFADGFAHYLNGEFVDSGRICADAERHFRDVCTNVSWEIGNSQRFHLASRMYLGDVTILREGLRAALAEAGERGDLLQAADLQLRLNISWLTADEPEVAEANIANALAHWAGIGFNLQHLSAMCAIAQVALYRGSPREGLQRVDGMWPDLKRSFILRVQMLRIEAYIARAASAIGVGGAAELRRAESDVRTIARESMAWSDPIATLLRAGILRCRQDDGCLELLRAAAEGFDSRSMRLYRDVARLRIAQVTGDGVDEAVQALVARGVAKPHRLAQVLAPGFGDLPYEPRDAASTVEPAFRRQHPRRLVRR
ncbi:MAG: protein kinase [Alphaproteobacteria bacterium]|nr:protein kinase [Alphaproteobacteria bacterium]